MHYHTDHDDDESCIKYCNADSPIDFHMYFLFKRPQKIRRDLIYSSPAYTSMTTFVFRPSKMSFCMSIKKAPSDMDCLIAAGVDPTVLILPPGVRNSNLISTISYWSY